MLAGRGKKVIAAFIWRGSSETGKNGGNSLPLSPVELLSAKKEGGQRVPIGGGKGKRANPPGGGKSFSTSALQGKKGGFFWEERGGKKRSVPAVAGGPAVTRPVRRGGEGKTVAVWEKKKDQKGSPERVEKKKRGHFQHIKNTLLANRRKKKTTKTRKGRKRGRGRKGQSLGDVGGEKGWALIAENRGR